MLPLALVCQLLLQHLPALVCRCRAGILTIHMALCVTYCSGVPRNPPGSGVPAQGYNSMCASGDIFPTGFNNVFNPIPFILLVLVYHCRAAAMAS